MEIIQTPEDELELLPLAMLTDIDRPRVTQAAIVRQITPQWCSPPVARLYRLLKDEPDDTYWMIWVHTQLAGDKETLERFHKAMTQVSGVNLTLKTIAKNLKERYINNETQRLMGEFILAETMKKKQDIITQLQKALNTSADDNVEVIDMAKRSAPVSYLLSKDEVGFAPRKEICAVKGRAKHGKTHLLSIFMAAIMQGQREEICGVKATQPDLKILYVDTEQSTWSSEHILETAMSMAGVPTDRNSPQLTCINLRKTLKARRKSVIEEYISSGKFDVVMVDGIKDLCTDFNDLKEADQLMVDVLAMIEAYNVAFITVLHENPTGDTSKMRGHLGTEVENKAFEVFQSKKIDEVFNITNTERRAKNVKTFAFKFNDDDEPESCEPNDDTQMTTDTARATVKKQTKEEKITDAFARCFSEGFIYQYSQLQERFVLCTEKSTRTFADWLVKAQAYGLVEKGEMETEDGRKVPSYKPTTKLFQIMELRQHPEESEEPF